MPEVTKKKKVLIIDDDEIMIAVAQKMLKDDYDVISSTSGKEALELLYKKLTPDIILLDILMPNMDGWEIFKKIKTISFLFDTPIVFVSSQDESEIERHAYEVGAKAFIRKPFKKKDLLTRLDSILRKNRSAY